MSDQTQPTFPGEKYINLESYRKNGQAVATPVWFAEGEGLIYVYSLADAYKVKRIRNNPKVRVAACDFRGGLKGSWLEARARIITGDEEGRADALLDQKYGLMRKIGGFFTKLRGQRRAFIVIEVV